MNAKHLKAVIAITLGSLLMSCHSQIDLNNVDTTAELQMGLALPVGTIRISVGDIFGDSSMFYVDSLENRGVLTWKDTFSMTRNYHQMDLSQYISSVDLTLKVFDQLQNNPVLAGMINAFGKISTGPDPVPVTLHFPLDVPMTGINDNDQTYKERLDSAMIEMASFASTISTSNLPLEWDWIDTVILELGEQINRPAGNNMIVYDRTDKASFPFYDFGEQIPTKVDNFNLVMMKNRHPQGWGNYAYNVMDTCKFNVEFRFTLPPYTNITVPANAGFKYRLDVQFINYTAIWGMFEPSKDMSDRNVIDLGDSWGDLEFITKAKLPFSDPKIDVDIKTTIAGALFIKDAYLFTTNGGTDTTWAEFGDDRVRTRDIYFNASQYLSPSSPIGTETKNLKLHFNKTADGGRIDKLFHSIPKQLGYCFAVGFNQMETPQIRILPSTSIAVNAECRLPLVLGEGVTVNYKDTMEDVSISQFSIDSLVNQITVVDEIKDAEVKLVIVAQNTIPLDAKVVIRFLDEKNQVIKDPRDSTKDFLLIPADTFKLAAPQIEYVNGNWLTTKPGESTIIASLDRKQLDVFPKIKKIQYHAIIDDEGLQGVYEEMKKPGVPEYGIKITNDEGIGFKIGLSANVDAILNFKQEQ